MKKHNAFFAVMLAAGCTAAAGCSGCASCNGNNQNAVALSSNWYSVISYKDIQPTLTAEEPERIKYTVAFKEPEIPNPTYSVSYGEGEYTTEFYARTFDVNTLTDADLKATYADKGEITAYYYRTELSIKSVTFTLKDGASVTPDGEESIISESYFLPVKDFLRPLYSKQEIKTNTPANISVKDIADAYKKVDSVYENFYGYDGKAVKSYITNNLTGEKTEKYTDKLDRADYTVFDNFSLNISVRALNLSAGTSLSQNICLYTPVNGVSTHTMTGVDVAVGSDEEKAAIAEKLKGANLYKDSENGLQTVAVSATYNGDLTGVSQTYWFAAVENKSNNTGRATMLKMSTPLPFGLGTLEYKLNTIEKTFWNK